MWYQLWTESHTVICKDCIIICQMKKIKSVKVQPLPRYQNKPTPLPMGTWGCTKLCKNRFGLESSKWETRNGESRKWEGTLAEVGEGASYWSMTSASQSWHTFSGSICLKALLLLLNGPSSERGTHCSQSGIWYIFSCLRLLSCSFWLKPGFPMGNASLEVLCLRSVNCLQPVWLVTHQSLWKLSSYRSMSSASATLCLFLSSWCFQNIDFRLGHTHGLNDAPQKYVYILSLGMWPYRYN